jgi:hypothetical protein
MDCVSCGSVAVTERPELTAQAYRRIRYQNCGKQFNERSDGVLNRALLGGEQLTLLGAVPLTDDHGRPDGVPAGQHGTQCSAGDAPSAGDARADTRGAAAPA